MLTRSLVGGLAIATFALSPQVDAQRQRPLTPLPSDGLRVAPFFDGWYENRDGTIALSFGYSNLNKSEVVEIPLGPDNVIQPKEYDGRQPTSFPPVAAASGGDGSGAPSSIDRRLRERGVFTVTVPAGFRGDVVWTLRYQGQTYSVPGRARVGAYRLDWPMAMGSVPPLLRFSPTGPSGRGPVGIHADPQRVTVGVPLSLTIWTNDDSEREKDPVPIKRTEKSAINVSWYKHAGPGGVVFTPPRTPIAELQGTATTSAVFTQPGEYVVRVRADNFGRVDTSPGNQCCWTNGYISVTVTP